MPGDVRSLTVRWLGDASSLVKSTTQAERAVTSSGKKIEGAGNSIGSKFGSLSKVLGTFGVPFSGSLGNASKEVGTLEQSGLGMGGAMGGAVTAGLAVAAGAAVAFGKQSVEAAMEFDHAHEQLKTVVENTGAAVSGWAGKVDGADSKMRGLGFTSTETEGALAKLIPTTHSVQGATALLSTAADLARARNETLGEATQTLVAVEAGRMKGLAKLGIATKDVNGKTISAKQAIQELTDLYRGSASQYAQTYAGQLAVLKATMNDLKVTVGNALMPTLSVLATEGSAALGALDAGAHHLGTSLGGVVAGVLTLGGSVLLHAWQSQHKGAEDAADAVKNLKKAQQDYANDLAAGDTTSQKALADRKAYSDAQTKAAAIQKGLTDATTSATGATAAQTAATAAATKAAKAAAEQQQKETDAILGTRDASISLSNAALGVSDSLDTYNTKAKAAADAGGKNAQANRDWEKASNDVKSAIDGVASSAANAATQQAQLHGKTIDAQQSADAQRLALEKLRNTIAPGNPFRSYLDGLIRDLDRVAEPRHGKIDVQVIGHTSTGQPITFHPTRGTVSIPGGGVLLAEGGYVPGPIGAPVPATVHGGEYVTRAQDVAHMRGASVNNYAITVNVAPGSDPSAAGKAVVDAIRAYEKRNGTSWRAA